MIRLSALAGLPVILEGRPVGRVEQAVLTRDGRQLRGLLVRQGLRSARWVSAADVLLVGRVSVIAARAPVKPPADAAFSLTSVKDTGGLQLGRVTDVWLDEATGRTGALEISLGPVETLRGGRVTACAFTACPTPEEPGQVLVPCGTPLLHGAPAQHL